MASICTVIYIIFGRRRSIIMFYVTVSHLVAHFELCFLDQFSYFSGQLEPFLS